MHGVLGATRNRTEARGAPFTLCPILPQRASIRAGSARCSAIFSQVKRCGLLFCGEPHSAPATSVLRRFRGKRASAASWPSASAANARLRQAAFHIRDELAFRARSKHMLAASRSPHPQQTRTRGKLPSVPAISRFFQKKSALCNIESVLKSRNVAFSTQNGLWMTQDCHSKRFERSRAVTKRPFFGNIGD